MAEGLGFLTIAEAAGLIERKALSPVELVTALITRAEQADPQINAYQLLTAERARAGAPRGARNYDGRLYRDRDWSEEPANTFQFPD
jgi:Asp-tRNA(Asn)/Glu-tRNA(Gln) amidotransferase A subunit family amidase